MNDEHRFVYGSMTVSEGFREIDAVARGIYGRDNVASVLWRHRPEADGSRGIPWAQITVNPKSLDGRDALSAYQNLSDAIVDVRYATRHNLYAYVDFT